MTEKLKPCPRYGIECLKCIKACADLSKTLEEAAKEAEEYANELWGKRANDERQLEN